MPRKAVAKTGAGRMIEVQLAHLTKGLVTIRVKANGTVGDVLEAAGVTARDIFLNGKSCAKSTKVKAKDVIGAVTQVDGGLLG